jgi:tmRNA-binding protein
MKKYRVRVETPGKLIFFKNRKVRTPFELDLTEHELEIFKVSLHLAGVEEYSVNEIKKTDDDVEESIIIPQKEEVVIEDLNIDEIDEPTTILEKLLRDDKNGE